MKAIILAGGDGKRLRPITCTMPKPMVPLLNKPTIFYCLDLIKKYGIKDVVITLGYMGDVLKRNIGDGSAWGLNVSYSDPERRLGTAGSVKYAMKNCNETALVLSGDGITDVDLKKVIDEHKKAEADVTVVLYRVSEPTEYGVALTDENGFINGFIEKPSRSEVFSDLANTGIYVLEPSAIEDIPQDTEYDFSKELFPKIMGMGKRIFGSQAEGYWCDIGDVAQYRQAQQDMLDGKCMFETIAKNRDGIFIEPNAMISAKAVLKAPCYIGAGAEIGDLTCIEPYSVIGSNAKVYDESSIGRSIVLNGATVRQDAEIRGAVICENAEIGERAFVFEGSVIGAETTLNEGSVVTKGASIWPQKEVEAYSSCVSNVVWGEPQRIKRIAADFVGYCDTSMTPESSLRIAAAFAAKFSPPSSVCVGSDGNTASEMLRYAIISGVASQGSEVNSIPALSFSGLANAVVDMGSSGGIYVKTDMKKHISSLSIVDGRGLEADDDMMRSIEKTFLFGEQKPVTREEIGIVRICSGSALNYEAKLLRRLSANAMIERPKKLILSCNERIGESVAVVLLRLGWDVRLLPKSAKPAPIHERNTIAITYDDNGEISAYTFQQGKIEYHSLLCAIAVEGNNRSVVVPVDIAEPLEKYLNENGIRPIRGSTELGRRKRYAMKEGVYIPEMFEPEAFILKTCELFSQDKFDDLFEKMPTVYRSENSIDVGWKNIGRMLRMLVEKEREATEELNDGVRLKHDTGWVTVKPRVDRAAFRVIAGSMRAEYAKELCDIYMEKLKNIGRDSKQT